MISLILPPVSAPQAFQTLASSFASMMSTAGVTVEPIAHDGQLPVDTHTVLYTWHPGQRPEQYPRARHIEVLVDGDWPPTLHVERIYPSKAWRVWMMGKYSCGHGEVVPNWVNLALWPLGRGEDDFILYVGRLWPNKYGVLDRLIGALPNERFKIAGLGDRSHITAHNVEFLGHVTFGLAELMGRAKAVLCPSQYCEPFGLAAVEAGLTGARVLASDIGGFHETVPPESCLLDPYDIDVWVDAVQSRDDGSRQLRRAWHTERHSFEAVALQYARLLCTTVVTEVHQLSA